MRGIGIAVNGEQQVQQLAGTEAGVLGQRSIHFAALQLASFVGRDDEDRPALGLSSLCRHSWNTTCGTGRPSIEQLVSIDSHPDNCQEKYRESDLDVPWFHSLESDLSSRFGAAKANAFHDFPSKFARQERRQA